MGINNRRDRVLTYLRVDSDQELRVISIFGFGGLGKTTLAKAIYDSPQVKNGQFHCQAFVTVSQKIDLKALLRDMLGQLIPPASDQHVSSDIEDEHLKAIEVWDVKRLGDKLRSLFLMIFGLIRHGILLSFFCRRIMLAV